VNLDIKIKKMKLLQNMLEVEKELLSDKETDSLFQETMVMRVRRKLKQLRDL